MQLGDVGVGDLVERAVVHEALGLVDVLGIHLQLVHEELEDARVGAGGDLEAHHAREATLLEEVLRGFQEILGVLVVALHLGVSGDAEGEDLQDLHAGEEVVEVVLDDLLHGDEVVAALEAEEPRGDLGHLDAREELLALAGAAQHDAERDAHVADEREAVAGVDGERREDGEDAAAEPRLGLHALRIVELLPAQDADAVGRQARQHAVAERDGLAVAERGHAGADTVELLRGGQRLGHGAGDAGLDLALEDADALHEELVEVRRVDGEEAQALEKRRARVGGDVEDACVELEPLDVAVEEARRIGVVDGEARLACGGGGAGSGGPNRDAGGGVAHRPVPWNGLR